MRIGIDCRLAGTKHAGIGRYIQNLLRHTLTNNNHDWVLFFYDQQQAQLVLGKLFSLPRLTIVYSPVKHYSVAEQLRMPLYFYRAKLDLLHVPHFNAPILYFKPLVVTIHDLLWHHHRGSKVTTLSALQYWLKYFFYRLTVRCALVRAAKVIVPAQTIKQTVSEYFPKAKNKIEVTYEGVEESLLQPVKTKRQKNTLLYVGSLYPHKNVRLVIAALHKLPQYQLEIAGSRNIFTKQTQAFIHSLGLQKQVSLLGYLSDQALRQKYAQVTALVQPSLSEGFGLTGVEAMTQGTPILASDIPIFREIYQDGAILFNPHKVDDFVAAVKKLETTNLKSLEEKVKKIAQKYSWKKMAVQTISIYEKAL